ncbi:uncharacterized protein LOC110973281 [Acanthaster planci]|uniref:Uncharacterized protein LOC110973281 n=1 Tax=Acanthaster planci TaxID=133434 RepID=A0A8B7XFW2_ACAPL|nr:uncharacterized protein LOC110973281 [Acanthaster planci]
MTHDPVHIAAFYYQLKDVLQNTPSTDTVVVFGDFNARANATKMYNQEPPRLGLTIHTRKTKVMLLPHRHTVYADPELSLDGNQLQDFKLCTALPTSAEQSNSLDKEVERSISAATTACGKLQSKIWKKHYTWLTTKCKVYRAVVLTCLLYSSKTYILYRRHKRLQLVYMYQLRHLLKIHWQDRISDVEVRRRTGIPSVAALLKQSRLQWSSHVVRMEDSWLPKAVFFVANDAPTMNDTVEVVILQEREGVGGDRDVHS